MRHSLAQATLDKVGPDEPIFVLRAQDKLAPLVIEVWAAMAAAHLGADHEKVIAAHDIADAMHDHPNRKFPD